MNFEGGSPKSKGIARNRKYVNLADVIRKIDYVTRSCGSSSQMRKKSRKSWIISNISLRKILRLRRKENDNA